MAKPNKIFVATDHAGFELKELAKQYLQTKGYEVVDFGAHTYQEADDYPEFIVQAAKAVSENPTSTRGVIFGGTGEGEAMVANRHKGVRCTVYYGNLLDIVKLGREHNDANMLSIGARFVSEQELEGTLDMFLDTQFTEEERHVRRNGQIDAFSL